MVEPYKYPICRKFSLILICALLGACATTQKSSTGSGEQSGATGSEAAQSQNAAKPGATPDSGAVGTQAQSSASAAKSAGAAGTAESAAAAREAEASQLKRQLAEQDAQISKLRDEEKAGAERLEAEAAMGREQQAAVAAAAAGTAQTGPTSASKGDDELVVFPANPNAQEVAGSESAVARTHERSVYFAYDQSTVSEKYDSMLMAHAAYFEAHPSFKVEVQGNCDERGSREYNLALGARRAQAVKRALELAGVDGSRITVISYGAEKPVATGKDEQSYSQNRRADIVY